MEKVKVKGDETVKNKTLAFFMIASPTILIIALASWFPNSWILQVSAAVYQFIILKQFLDRYYEVL